MKKLTFAATTILALSLTASNLQAKEASTEENVGFFSGAVSGAAIGGPIGFILGGVAGVIMGDQVHQANQVEGLESQLSEQTQMNSGLYQELDDLQADIQQTNALLDAKTSFITQELTLNLMFDSNSSDLTEKDLHLVNRVSDILTDFPELNIQLDGYADPVGNPEDNLSLSSDRTLNVKDAFEAMGISANRIITNSHGESLSTIKYDDTDSYALERKVSINFNLGGQIAEENQESENPKVSQNVAKQEELNSEKDDSDTLAVN